MPARPVRLLPAEPGVSQVLARSLAGLRQTLHLPDQFPADVLAESERAAEEVSVNPDRAGLADLRSIPFLTIDPAGSTDLDQALHLERTASGAILHYAIADVAAFVEPGGPTDAETRRRGQTLYAPDGRVPLHPPVLSEGAASLLPGTDRRAYVWRFVLDDGARPLETTLRRAIVRSREQWSYRDAQAAIDEGTAPDSLAAMPWFGEQRTERERERGGVSLNLPEAEIIPEPNGYRIERSLGVPLEDWNAHVSLLTGMAAAEIMLRGGVGILRTMPPADPADVAEFRARTIMLGLPWRLDVTYGDYLRALPRTPQARAVKEYAARLFRGAGYAVLDSGADDSPPEDTMQSAIGAPYAHATAPLRRLVDRWALVICEALANGRDVPAWARASLAELPGVMARSSQQAGQLTRGALDRVESALLAGREGEVFRALVLSVRGNTAQVQLSTPAVSASVAMPDAEPGAIVDVQLARTDVMTGLVEFALVADAQRDDPAAREGIGGE